MTAITFRWSEFIGVPAVGSVTVTRRSYRLEPDTVFVPFSRTFRVRGEAVHELDPSLPGQGYELTWKAAGTTEALEQVIIVPEAGEPLLAHLLAVDPSTLEPLPPEQELTAGEALARAEAAAGTAAESATRAEASAEDAAETAAALRADADALEDRILAKATPDLSGYATTEQLVAATSAPRVVPLVTDGWTLGAAGGEDVPLGTLGQVTNTSFVRSGALLIRSSLSRWSSWSILRGQVTMSHAWLNRKPYPEVGIVSFGADQTEARVINFFCSLFSTDTVKWNWSVFVPDDMGDNNGTFFYRWSDALGITPTEDYVHPETGEVGKLYRLEDRDVDVPDYGGMYYDDDLLADALTFDVSRFRLVRTAK